MILNHERKPVWEWESGESLCPDCGARLSARKGEVKVWHWAHLPTKGGRRTGCDCEETAWHVRWKMAYLGLPGWAIEQPCVVNGVSYRVDAVNTRTLAVREFVHSLSPSYAAKHKALAGSNLDVMWLADGDEFASARRLGVVGTVSGPGYRRLLKPRAYDTHKLIGMRVHFEGKLWREWKNDVWFQMTGEAAAEMLCRYEAAQSKGGRP